VVVVGNRPFGRDSSAKQILQFANYCKHRIEVLFKAPAIAGRANDIRRFHFDVLADNTPMLKVLERFGVCMDPVSHGLGAWCVRDRSVRGGARLMAARRCPGWAGHDRRPDRRGLTTPIPSGPLALWLRNGFVTSCLRAASGWSPSAVARDYAGRV